MFYRGNFLTFQWENGRFEGEVEVEEKVQGIRVVGKVCDSVTQNVQFDVICQMIS